MDHPLLQRAAPPLHRLFGLASATAVALGAGSCAAPAPVPERHPDDLKGVEAAEHRTGPIDASRDSRAALLNGQPIMWEDLRPAMAEAAGAQALQEAVLDRLLAEQMRSRGLTVAAADIEAERTLLAESVSRDAAATPADAARLLDQVRRTRGLGEFRFERLLERNARMRKLIASTVAVPDAEVEQAFEMAHGVRYRARLIITATPQAAAEARALLTADETNRSVRFAEAAMKSSTDASAGHGGLLEPISPLDPAYPAAARRALEALRPGEISPVIPLDRGFALLLLEEQIPADSQKLADAAPRIRAEVQKRRERLAMDELARSLLRSAQLSILDRGLDWSWKNATGCTEP